MHRSKHSIPLLTVANVGIVVCLVSEITITVIVTSVTHAIIDFHVFPVKCHAKKTYRGVQV